MSNVLLTGSRVYGPVTENSDIDVVMFKAEALELLNKITLLGLKPEVLADYGDASSFKFSLTDGLPPINIIVVDDEVDWLKWEFATNEMRALEPIVDRSERIQMFHFFQMEGLDRALKVRRDDLFKEYAENTKDLRTEFMESAEACSLGGFPQSSYQAKALDGFVDVDDEIL